MFNQQHVLVTIETDILHSRVRLVSLDHQSHFYDRNRLREMRGIIKEAVRSGCEYVSVPRKWFEDLEAAYKTLF
jgi:hypothetical protein